MNLTIVKILGSVAVIAILAVVGLLLMGHNTEAAITGLVGLASGAIGQLGGVLRARNDKSEESEIPDA